MANLGNYQAAVDLFSQAINLDAKDFRFGYKLQSLQVCQYMNLEKLICTIVYFENSLFKLSLDVDILLSVCRFFGNRSYCYDRMGQYEKALQDADVAISLAPDWPKGYFRRGRALAGLKVLVIVI